MGTATSPPPVKLIVGVLASSAKRLEDAAGVLTERFGPVDAASIAQPWTVSEYYRDEMGPVIVRQFLSFAHLIAPGNLAGVKQIANQLERRWRRAAGRQVNIDPGYIATAKLVLASTKDAAHRVYLNGGIYAEVTLHFQDGTFVAHRHTYPDYAMPETVRFFNGVRATYLAQLRTAG